jgi:superfamily II RNA helicase
MFSEAESIPISFVKCMVKMTVRAFRYGFALMMPAFPFVVTYTIRKYLNERRIPFVFSTHEMAVGINYGLRNVIILRSSPTALQVKPSLLVQMAGRAGRRGLDSDARIIYANINNLSEVLKGYIEPLRHPEVLHLPEDAECVSLKQSHELTNALLQMEETSGVLQTLFQQIRRPIPLDRQKVLTTFITSPKMDEETVHLISMKEKEYVYQLIQDLRAMLVVWQQIHWHASIIESKVLAKRLYQSTRTAIHQMVKISF